MMLEETVSVERNVSGNQTWKKLESDLPVFEILAQY